MASINDLPNEILERIFIMAAPQVESCIIIAQGKKLAFIVKFTNKFLNFVFSFSPLAGCDEKPDLFG